MSRRGSRGVSLTGGRSAPSVTAVNIIAGKENEYREGIEENRSNSGILAERIAHGAQLETDLMAAAGDNEQLKEEITSFLATQRERLKKISEKNVFNKRSVDVFMSSLNDLRSQIQEEASGADYEKLLEQNMRKHREARKEVDVDLRDEEFCREIRQKLGEKETGAKRRNDDSDDDLEVVNPGTTSENSLKCPITGMLYEDPVKSKVCHHTYSRAGLFQVLNSGRPRCPMPGCANTNLSLDQVEKDITMTTRVRQFKRRKANEEQQRATQLAEDSDDEDVL